MLYSNKNKLSQKLKDAVFYRGTVREIRDILDSGADPDAKSCGVPLVVAIAVLQGLFGHKRSPAELDELFRLFAKAGADFRQPTDGGEDLVDYLNRASEWHKPEFRKVKERALRCYYQTEDRTCLTDYQTQYLRETFREATSEVAVFGAYMHIRTRCPPGCTPPPWRVIKEAFAQSADGQQLEQWNKPSRRPLWLRLLGIC